MLRAMSAETIERLNTALDGKQRDFIQTLRRSAEALLNIVNDILDFSRMESGKLYLENLDFKVEIQSVNESGSKANLIATRGSGPGGLEAARVAAERGHDVTVFEAAAEPGGQVRLTAQNASLT